MLNKIVALVLTSIFVASAANAAQEASKAPKKEEIVASEEKKDEHKDEHKEEGK